MAQVAIQNQAAQTQANEPMVRIRAYQNSVDGVGLHDVRWASVILTAALVHTLRRLVRVAAENGLSEVHVNGSPKAWGPGDLESEANLRGHTLIVDGKQFWFYARPKHEDAPYETEAMDIEDFLTGVARGQTVFGEIDLQYVENEEEAEMDD
jgi:hypothetical protein